MGHIRLGKLPRTRKWQHVIGLLEIGSDVSTVADASLTAAKIGLARAADDPGFLHTLTLIFQFLESSGSKEIAANLNRQGYSLPDQASLFDFVSGFKSKVDSDLNALQIKSDVSEIAQNAFTEVLFKYASPEIDSLFESTTETVKKSLSQFTSGNRLKGLMHEFFSVFTGRYLSYYLSRELSNHVGAGKRFENISRHQEFNQAFDLYIRQTIRIADEFTPGWFGKARYEQKLDSESVSKYAHVAFNKIAKEFARGG